MPHTLPSILRRLGELYAAKGNRAKAIEHYARFVELWRNADPELQPRVAEVRRRIESLRASGAAEYPVRSGISAPDPAPPATDDGSDRRSRVRGGRR